MTTWGLEVLARLPLSGTETVLDAGCGTGRVTAALRDRLPEGRVVALDASARMLEEARRRLGDDRMEYLQADLLLPLTLEPVDAVLSTATFHWVPDHDALFANLARVLRPGGALVAQCGGSGNIASVIAVLATVGDGWVGAHYFASPEETERRLQASGFGEIRTWLEERTTVVEPGPQFREYLTTVVLGSHLERLSPADHQGFVDEVVSRLGAPVLDYVRLNIEAERRP